MDEPQIRWGLSGGARVLAIAGFFWYGLSLGVISGRHGWLVWGASTACQVAITASLVWATVAMRRVSGFSRSDLWRGSGPQRAQTARIGKTFVWTILGQALLVGAAVWLCVRSGANDLLWPSIGLITSLHFVPLANVFHVRVYYVTALAGSIISLAALVGLGAHWLAWFGGGMAAVMWLSSWHVIRNADDIASRAVQETWAA